VAGVTDIENSVTLKSAPTTVGEKIDDTVVTARVKTALLADADIKSFDISVLTFNGEVQLSGFVNNQGQIDQAVRIAGAAEGATSVTPDTLRATASAWSIWFWLSTKPLSFTTPLRVSTCKSKLFTRSSDTSAERTPEVMTVSSTWVPMVISGTTAGGVSTDLLQPTANAVARLMVSKRKGVRVFMGAPGVRKKQKDNHLRCPAPQATQSACNAPCSGVVALNTR
jgi:hypothetical protein